MKQNNFLSAIKPDTANAITGLYEQTAGVLPVSGTDNVDGVVKFEVSDREKGIIISWCFTPSQPVRLYQGERERRGRGIYIYI